MATPKWQPGRLYPPGSLVVPRTDVVPGATALTNPGFEDGLTGWGTIGGGAPPAGWHAESGTGEAYTGSGCARWSGPETDGEYLWNEAVLSVGPGTRVRAAAYFHSSNAGDQIGGHIAIVWFDQNGNQVGFQTGNEAGLGGWRSSSSPGAGWAAPAGARTARIGVGAYNLQGGIVRVDAVSLSYTPYHQSGLQYKAVQPAAGYSDTTEPVWPGVLGQQVVDNEVVWEAVSVSRVVWEARPILKTGETEPAWPDVIGAEVADGTISWRASDPMTSDPNCPHSKIVAIAKFKVYAGDGDIVRYTATLSPQDWTTEKDAGYLGTGVQQNGANAVAVLNLYRANLIVMNATTFQQWQIDPDPAMMDLLDTMDGIGSIHHLAAQPVGNELFYLSNRGVRTVGISGATNNLRAGDIGMPVDPIIARLMAEAEAKGEPPLGMYLPSMGQYWLAFNREVPADGPDGPAIGSARDLCPTLQPGQQYAEVMVYTLAQVGEVGAWSRYVFPYPIDDWTQEGNDLYVRDGDTVYRISEEIGACDFIAAGGDGGSGQTPAPFDALIQWPWLDMGQPGSDKQIESFDIVGYGECEVEFGYDQSEPGWFTSPYLLPADSVPGTTIPMPLNAPSYSVRLRYHGWNPEDPGSQSQQHWGFNALGINFTR